MKLFNKFWKDRQGQGLVEYVLIISLVALAVMAALTLFGGNLTNILNNIVASI